MGKPHYEVLEPKLGLPLIDVARVTGDGRDFIVSAESLNPGIYDVGNRARKIVYARSDTQESVTFRPATTAESLMTLAGMEHAPLHRLSYLGRIATTADGAYLNVSGIENAWTLGKAYFSRMEEFNGIYLDRLNDVAFVPKDLLYQDAKGLEDPFSHGLLRGLELTKGPRAGNLARLAFKANASGINILNNLREPSKKEVVHGIVSTMWDNGLFSDRDIAVSCDPAYMSLNMDKAGSFPPMIFGVVNE